MLEWRHYGKAHREKPVRFSGIFLRHFVQMRIISCNASPRRNLCLARLDHFTDRCEDQRRWGRAGSWPMRRPKTAGVKAARWFPFPLDEVSVNSAAP